MTLGVAADDGRVLGLSADDLRRRLETFSRSADFYLAARGISARGEALDELGEDEQLLKSVEVEELRRRQQEISATISRSTARNCCPTPGRA